MAKEKKLMCGFCGCVDKESVFETGNKTTLRTEPPVEVAEWACPACKKTNHVIPYAGRKSIST